MDIEKKASEIRALGNGKIPIDLYTITSRLKINLLEKPSTSALISPGGIPQIIVNSRKHHYQQRVECAHEIGHFVLHVGNQFFMPETWTIKQEAEAQKFAYYFLIPTEELEADMTSGIHKSQLIYEVSQRFGVPISFASERLAIFERNVLYR